MSNLNIVSVQLNHLSIALAKKINRSYFLIINSMYLYVQCSYCTMPSLEVRVCMYSAIQGILMP